MHARAALRSTIWRATRERRATWHRASRGGRGGSPGGCALPARLAPWQQRAAARLTTRPLAGSAPSATRNRSRSLQRLQLDDRVTPLARDEKQATRGEVARHRELPEPRRAQHAEHALGVGDPPVRPVTVQLVGLDEFHDPLRARNDLRPIRRSLAHPDAVLGMLDDDLRLDDDGVAAAAGHVLQNL